MPRRHKRRPHPPEPEKATPFFVKPSTKEAQLAWVGGIIPEQVHKKSTEQVRNVVIGQLQAVKSAIASSLPEEALTNQSRALELANQMLAADIWDIKCIQQALSQICQTIQASHFLPAETLKGGQRNKQIIQLGHSFKLLSHKKKTLALLRAAIAATNLPDLNGQPTSKYEAVDNTNAWTEYVCSLLSLLPEQPYLITGSPTNHLPGTLQPEEDKDIDVNNPDSTDSVTAVPPQNRPSLSNRLLAWLRGKK